MQIRREEHLSCLVSVGLSRGAVYIISEEISVLDIVILQYRQYAPALIFSDLLSWNTSLAARAHAYELASLLPWPFS